MTALPVTKARATLYTLVENLQSGLDPVLIMGKRGNAVLISEAEWRSIEATLHLLAIPGMRASIHKGMREPVSKCSTSIDL